MSKVTIKFEGLDEISDALFEKIGLDPVKQIIKKNGAQLETRTKENMDAVYIKGYSTGFTKRATQLHFIDEGLTAEQSTDTEYIAYLENGTRFMPEGAPAIKPALERQKEIFLKDMKGLVK